MYLPSSFREERPEAIHSLVAQFPLATLVTLGPDGLEASLVPLLLDPVPRPGAPYGTLRGHLARANRQWTAPQAGVDALALFQGPNAYVSPNWYPSKAEHGKAVPTWNYAVVEARGPLTVIEDADWLRRLLAELTAVHESRQARPWSLDDAPEEYLTAQLKAIVGIEIAVRKLTGKWKMSQNRPAADRSGVEAALAAGDSAEQAVAQWVGRAAADQGNPAG